MTYDDPLPTPRRRTQIFRLTNARGIHHLAVRLHGPDSASWALRTSDGMLQEGTEVGAFLTLRSVASAIAVRMSAAVDEARVQIPYADFLEAYPPQIRVLGYSGGPSFTKRDLEAAAQRFDPDHYMDVLRDRSREPVVPKQPRPLATAMVVVGTGRRSRSRTSVSSVACSTPSRPTTSMRPSRWWSALPGSTHCSTSSVKPTMSLEKTAMPDNAWNLEWPEPDTMMPCPNQHRREAEKTDIEVRSLYASFGREQRRWQAALRGRRATQTPEDGHPPV